MKDAVASFADEVGRLLKTGVATEHSYRPAFKTLLESLDPNIVAVNEPKRVECGAPDFSVNRGYGLLIGHVECKDISVKLQSIASSDQIQRYKRALSNLIVTNHIDFWWYVDGELKEQASLGKLAGNGLTRDPAGAANVTQILTRFLNQKPVGATSAEELASRLAQLTHLLRDVILNSIQAGAAPSLSDLLKACRQTILPNVTTEEFADVFAQTLSYGLFAARLRHDDKAGPFTRYTAIFDVPKSNPFLRGLFERLAGPAMDDEPYVGLVEDVASLLAQTKSNRILRDFGSPDLGKDPILHFYETFLAAYDPDIRERRGVYYTPLPIVEYIVNSLDLLLIDKLSINDGLASTTKSVTHQGSHEVLILDPACGTGTFLYAVIDQVRDQYMKTNNAGLWASSALHDLLPRLVGLELLMAPYALAHMKLGMEFSALDLPPAERDKWAAPIPSSSRLRVYLSNTLEHTPLSSPLPLGQWISAEANAATSVKSVEPVLVILGNLPYQGHSSNRGKWIRDLISDYRLVDGAPLLVRQSPLAS